ncbi:uncharacterized protein BBOV_IV000305 [Babesia bovis T2Bo]|uniref:uncharacterized protein n=1 Tax=Babesia bovis T2Bo TaxID=484906 RepID=UPI001D6A5DF0|nr:uncharacterized protein BBOV_IV000305 [Babesia bovis T2Bo]KAG6439929.1 hypothetical protein BBOV_IV000305 [Babesia bovis T2Bo]
MNSIKVDLLNRLVTSSSCSVASIVRRCVREGVTGRDELRQIAAVVFRHIDNLGANDIVSILSSLSKARYRNFHLFSALVDKLEQYPSLPLTESRSILVFFSKIHFTNSTLVTRCATVVRENIDHLRPQDVCDILHALTRLRYHDNELIQALITRGICNIKSVDAISLINFATGCSKSEVNDKTIHEICRELQERATSFGPFELLRALIVLSRFRIDPDIKEAGKVIVKCIKYSQLTLLQLTVCLEAMNALGFEDKDDVVTALKRKRDSYPTVSSELSARIDAALDGKTQNATLTSN